MKTLALLPLAFLAFSCAPPLPYRDQRPPLRDGEPYYPYGPGGQAPGTETGTFEPVPQDGSTPPPPDNRPPAPQIDPYGTDPAPAPVPAPRPEYPTAKRTANPNEVISPYPPYNVIDVEGFKSGQLAKDPSNKKIFRVP